MQGQTEGLYLFHFDPRYGHAGHYLGWSKDIPRRVRQHTACGSHSSPLIRAAINAGCKLTVSRIWLGADRHEERRLKNRGGLARQCPICKGETA